jgi:hypothetical protein
VRGVREGALPAGLRQTAANRPGQAQPVPTRDIPTRPWVKMGMFAFVAATLLTAAWEWNARANLGLRSGDIDDSPQAWAQARRSADLAKVAIVGDSRILFDTDQARFQALTGVRPVQASFVGTNSRTLLEHFANDPNFHGLLIVGMADTMYFGMPVIGLGGNAVHNYEKNGKPSQLTGLWLDRQLQNYLAFMDSDYRLSRWAPRFDNGWRKGADSPYEDVWKISEVFPGRQFFMWDQIETDRFLQGHARHAWQGFKGPNIPQGLADKVIARSVLTSFDRQFPCQFGSVRQDRLHWQRSADDPCRTNQHVGIGDPQRIAGRGGHELRILVARHARSGVGVSGVDDDRGSPSAVRLECCSVEFDRRRGKFVLREHGRAGHRPMVFCRDHCHVEFAPLDASVTSSCDETFGGGHAHGQIPMVVSPAVSSRPSIKLAH